MNTPRHTKEIKNLQQSYRPISSLSIFRKIFEKAIVKDLFTKCQSGHFTY